MDDNYFMNLAIMEAEKSKESDGYNVGAVITKGNRIISIGRSNESDNGGHAEERAIRDAGDGLVGATIYTTMEPCSQRHTKRKSCSQLIIEAGIRRVIYGTKDPEIDISCNGINILESVGIEVIQLKGLEERCKGLCPSIF